MMDQDLEDRLLLALADARERVAAGQTISMGDVLAEHGLTVKQWLAWEIAKLPPEERWP